MIDVLTTYLVVVSALLLCVILALVRVVRGPTAPDRVVGVDTINTIVIVGMVAFGAAFKEVIYIDVAIVYALLSFISTLFIAKYLDILLISGQAEMVTFGPAKVFFPSTRIPLSSILNFTHDYIALLNKDLQFVQVNDNLLAVLGITRDDIIGQPIDTFTHQFFQIPAIAQHAHQALNGKQLTSEHPYNDNNRTFYLFIQHIPTTFDDGEPGAPSSSKTSPGEERPRRSASCRPCSSAPLSGPVRPASMGWRSTPPVRTRSQNSSNAADFFRYSATLASRADLGISALPTRYCMNPGPALLDKSLFPLGRQC
jgi:multisubunit Na+/H+ antiporter MnhF subunit